METIILSEKQSVMLLNYLKPKKQILHYGGMLSGKTYCYKLAKEILQKDPESINEFVEFLEKSLRKQKNRR